MEQARQEMLDWHGSGMSVMEMSHRGPQFMDIAARAEHSLRQLLNVSDDYAVLFLQGGASSQFSMVPMNLIRGQAGADYFNTGAWSKKAIAEAKRYTSVNVAVDASDSHFTTVPDPDSWQLSDSAAYVHYTPNETIHGLEMHDVPDVGDKPLIADMSSTLLSRPIDVNRFGMIYAGAQKNIGPAGLCIAIIRKDLIGNAIACTPALFNYQTHYDNGSMYNTPPTYSWYLAGLVFDWLLEQGGLDAMGEINRRKAAKLYAAIDESDFYANPIDLRYRSWMNIPFTLADSQLEKLFLDMAAKNELLTLKGHRDIGGMRASIYNAMPESGVDKLIEFMSEFERSYG